MAGFGALSARWRWARRRRSRRFWPLACAVVAGQAFRPASNGARPPGIEADQKYIVCNADEGDSGTFADRMLMEGDPFLLIEGMAIAGVSVGATKGYVYIRSEYPHAFATFQRAIERARAGGLLGPSVLGSGHAFDLEARLGAGAYICGEETSLLESLEGKRGQIRAKPPLARDLRACSASRRSSTMC